MPHVRTVPIQVNVSPEIKARIEAGAATEQLTLSAFIRRAVVVYCNQQGY